MLHRDLRSIPFPARILVYRMNRPDGNVPPRMGDYDHALRRLMHEFLMRAANALQNEALALEAANDVSAVVEHRDLLIRDRPDPYILKLDGI
jgi:hypothetical protein